MGIAATSGNLRDFSATAYIVGLGQFVSSVESTMKKYFQTHAEMFPYEKRLLELSVSSVERLENGLGDLERGMRRYIVRDKPGVSLEQLKNLQSYLSFWVMDLIDPLLHGHEFVDVWKLTVGWDVRETDSVYFCIRMAQGMLVLQFSNNIGFKRQREDGLLWFDG
ncbi:MAG: hypothetical protein ABJN26_23670 [Stappiaceae bacterium]